MRLWEHRSSWLVVDALAYHSAKIFSALAPRRLFQTVDTFDYCGRRHALCRAKSAGSNSTVRWCAAKWSRVTASVTKQAVGGRPPRYATAPLLPRGRRSASRGWADGNVAAVSHGQHVPTPTAAAAWRANTAVSKAAWWPWPLTF